MNHLQQDDDKESDALMVTKTSPMIIRLCTKPTDMNKNMSSSENSQNPDGGSSSLYESANENIEELVHLNEKSNLDINFTIKDPIKIDNKLHLNEGSRSVKGTLCPYANLSNVSVKAKFKSVCSSSKPTGSINFCAKSSKTKSSYTSEILSDDSEMPMEACKIETRTDDRKGKSSISLDNVSEDFSCIPKANDKCDITSSSLKVKSKEVRKKRPLSPEGTSKKDAAASKAKRKFQFDDLKLNSAVEVQSSGLSTNVLYVDGSMLATASNQKPPQLQTEGEENHCNQLNKVQSRKSGLSYSSIFSEAKKLVKPEVSSLKIGHEKTSRNKKQYRNHPTISSSEESNDLFGTDNILPESNTENKSSVLSFKSNLEIEDDDVGDLEINELEQIREALKQQLLQNVEASPEMFQSNDSNEKIDALNSPVQSTNIELSNDAINKSPIPDQKNKAESSEKNIGSTNLSFEEQSENSPENYTNSFNCFVPKTVDQPSVELHEVNFGSCPRKEAAFNLGNDPGKTAEFVDEPAKEKLSNEVGSTTDQLPLVMQSSNLLINDELDNRHGGGGIETTRGKEEEPVTKLILSDEVKDIDMEFESTIVNVSKTSSPNEDFEKTSIQPDDMASNSTLDLQNSEHNGGMEFDIVDEFESDENEPEVSDSDDYTDLSMDEIDAMLDEGLQNSGMNINKELGHEEKKKVILKVRGRDHFDVLPEGWIEVTHNSGMPIYLHKQTRVCSVSKPYFLGPGSTRKHEIPVSAIPCLHYLRELEKENAQPDVEENQENSNSVSEKLHNSAEITEGLNGISEDVMGTENINRGNDEIDVGTQISINVSNSLIPSAKLESVKDTKEAGSLDYLTVREYCQKRFEFQTITVKRFRTWSGRRKHQKRLKRKQRPFLPDSTKLITCPLLPAADKNSTLGSNAKREFIMNPSGKSPVCILHEYVQHTLRVQPKYKFKELESATTPYGAVVLIDNIEYGSGFGSSKKLAKSDAAKSALQILIPKMKMFSPGAKNGDETQDVEFFDQVRVEDPRVSELSVKAGQPYPYQILLECLKRNYGMGDTEIEFWMTNLKHQKNEFFMKVGKHQVSVLCKNKRDGKHRASQAILQQLHPHIKSWGSLLRMYGKGSCKTLKEKKEEEQRITELQSKACVNKPNMSILNKLKEEMLKYREKMMNKKPIGKLIPERLEFFCTSNSNLNNVEL